MRISTSMLNDAAVNGILQAESQLSATQAKLSTGQNINSPADDPVGAVQLLQLNNAGTQYQQYISNGRSANTNLSLEQNALSGTTTALQSVQDLIVQANSGANNSADLQAIATQIQQIEQQLVGTANSKNAQGEYLFAGYAVNTQPFIRGSSGSVSYVGDAGANHVPLDSGTSVQTGDPGSSVFMNIPTGNGTFTAAASAANTGTGVIDAGSVTERSAWVADTYTISFSSPTQYTVTDQTSGAVVVPNGTYDAANGGSIDFNGVEIGISGTPAAGDTFTVAPSTNTGSIFNTLDSLVSSLQNAGSGAAARAQLSSSLAGSLQQVQQAMDQVSTVTTTVGTRISLIGSIKTSVTAQSTAIATQVSNLNALDYASATSQYSQEYLALQAAEESYAQLGQLSLFKYLG